MKKNIFLIIIFIFTICSHPFAVNAATAKTESKFIVYYFHTTGRCPTCIKMEKYTNEAVKAYFSNELKSGKIEFKVVNVDMPENEHFMKDYGLYTKSVVISEIKSGKEIRWKNLDKIWTKVRDKNEFMNYIKQETLDFIKGAKK
jgi:thiol-disulfide isomerase/thioredoxin